MRIKWVLCGLLFLVGFAFAENPSAKRILAGYNTLRPTVNDLAMYRLDWEDSLHGALERAAKENRPICLIIIHAKYGDITSGHC
tara:strand:- start:259 stop:510 length:252 start_codon:yes stop_codon:yes gene_type:complete